MTRWEAIRHLGRWKGFVFRLLIFGVLLPLLLREVSSLIRMTLVFFSSLLYSTARCFPSFLHRVPVLPEMVGGISCSEFVAAGAIVYVDKARAVL